MKMGRRGQKANKNTSSKSDAGVLNNIKMTNVQTRKRILSKENNIPHGLNQSITQSYNIFPYWLPWILFPFTFFIRLIYVLQPTNWWILHPDEVFQTMEVAHSEAFGYGFRTYEYLPPPSDDFVNSTIISDAHAHAIQHGMFSLRSFLLPKLLAVVMTTCDMCGSTASPFLIVKIFHVALTSLLPVAVYKFSRSLNQSKDIACMSAILVCSSLTSNVFATHTFINSFLSSVFFLSLIPFINSMKSADSEFASIHDDLLQNSTKTNGVHHKKAFDSDGMDLQNGQTIKMSSQTIQTFGKKCSSLDINLNVINSYEKISDMCVSKFRKLSNSASSEKQTNEEITKWNQLNKILQLTKEISTGLCLSLCIYIRVDLIFIPFLIIVCNHGNNFRNISKLVLKSNKRYIFGIISGLFFGGYCDSVAYGKWFLSPFQWYKFNVINSLAGKFFGAENVFFYLLKLYQNEPLASLSVLIVFIYIIQDLRTQCIIQKRLAKNQNLIIFLSMLLAFSLVSHKELRFMYNTLTFMYMSVSLAIFSVIQRFLQNQKSRQYYIYIVYLFIALFTSSHFFSFCNMKRADRAKWTYGKITDSHETNMCLDFIRQQKDVTGVFMDRSVYMTGGYSILHHDVPIFALNIFEFMEYKSDKHLDDGMGHDLSFRKYKGFSTFKDISDFISIYNAQYLFRKIRETPKYNFLILQTNSNFPDIGYDEVFRAGNTKVMFRTFDKEKEKKIQMETANTKIVLNATILEHEGSWLKHYGLYTKAEQRLMMSNKIDPKRIGIFRILLEMYRKLKHTDDYSSVLRACLQLYSRPECMKPYVPIGLHYG